MKEITAKLELRDEAFFDSFRPSQTASFLGIEVEEVMKALRTFNVADNITDIGAVMEQRVDGLNEFIFVCEDSLPGLRVNASPSGPELDVSDIATGTTSFLGSTKQMHQVSSPTRSYIEFLCG